MAFDLAQYKQPVASTTPHTGAGVTLYVKELLNKKNNFKNKGLNNKLKEEFYMQLSMLLASEINVKEALKLMVEESQNNSLKKVFTEVYNKITLEGDHFSNAMLKSGYFSPFEYYLFEIGERTGRLKEITSSLSKYFNNRIKQQRQLTSILIYPIIVLVSTFGLLFLMLKLIVPTYAKIFKGFKTELPWMTKAVIKASDALSAGIIYVVAIIVIMFTIGFISKNKIWYRKFSSNLILKIPFVGELVKKDYLSRFCFSLGFLINSNVEINEAIKLVKKTIQYYPIESTLDEMEKDITSGRQLSESMSRFPIYESRLVSVIRMSEGVKRVGFMFEKMAEHYEKEVEHKNTMIGTIMQPVILLLLGATVTIIAVAMYLPMFKMGKVIH